MENKLYLLLACCKELLRSVYGFCYFNEKVKHFLKNLHNTNNKWKFTIFLSWNFLGYKEKQSVPFMKPPNSGNF